MHPENHAAQMRMHLEGMWIAFGVAAAFIVYFVNRVTRDLALREAELAQTRAVAFRIEKIASLATLAAGAAHELSTPLSTIAVVANELERELEQGKGGNEQSADARFIREEVDRCREILLRMAADAGQSAGEGFERLSIAQLLEVALNDLPHREGVRLVLDETAYRSELHVPPRASVQALRAVVKNAQQATPSGEPVVVTAEVFHGQCRIEVRDPGVGMSPEVLKRVGEPFFTTKEPGNGMGLGLFLTRAVLERLGGNLELESIPGKGTTAVLRMPLGMACDNLPQTYQSPAVPT